MVVLRARSAFLVLVGATLVLGAPAAESGSSGVAFGSSVASVDVGRALALQRDGGLVLVGISRRGGREVMAVVRYRRGGAVDPTFGVHGIVLTAPANGRAAATAVAAQDDGRLVVAGGTFVTERQSVFALARYTRSGKLDATFGHSGATLTSFAAPPRPGKFALASAEDLALQRDGRIVAVGGTSNIVDRMQLAVARYTTTGALDSSFGQGGKVVAPLNSAPLGGVGAVALQRDGKIVVAGTTLIRVGNLSESRIALERFTRRGALDVRFGSGGKVVAPPIGHWDRAPDVAIQNDGKIVVASAVDLAMRHRQLGLARFLPSGELDTGFGDDGTVVTNFAVLGDAALAIQSDGKIVAACGLDGPRRFGVARYETDGTLDPGFGDGGKVRTRFPEGAAAHAVLVQPDGKIVVGGSSGGDFALARYTTDGSLDAGFGRGGTVTTPLGAARAGQRSP